MENISSLNSPHIERVKALIGPRGKKNRELENTFVVEGLQAVREALTPKIKEGLAVKKVYVTSNGFSKLQSEIEADSAAEAMLIASKMSGSDFDEEGLTDGEEVFISTAQLLED